MEIVELLLEFHLNYGLEIQINTKKASPNRRQDIIWTSDGLFYTCVTRPR